MISNRLTIAALALSTFTAFSQTTPPTTPKKPATTATPATTHTTPAHTAAASATPACVKIPDISPKIPALPPGAPCPKPLYTISTIPTVKLSYVSPLEGPGLSDALGIETTSFSLIYVDTKIGTGPAALPHKFYSIHYTGYLTDGTKFDSSVDRGEPITIEYGQHQVIPGWDTGFDGMHIGGKRRLFIPYQLAYGAAAHGPIPARSELIFDVELVSQSDTPPAPKLPPTPPQPAKPATEPAQPSAEPAKPDSAPQTPPSTNPNPNPNTNPNL
jgi:peptidylprolyl isomerase